MREPENDDWAKLVHLMKYIGGTRKLTLILSAKVSGILKWWIDGSFTLHPNMRGHTGDCLSMGRGFPIVSSTKHNLNTLSSNKTETLAVDDCIPAVIWNRYCLDSQGYDVFENIVYQDNKNAMILEKNGKAPRSKLRKHITIRHDFVLKHMNSS